ncbi:cold-shock protein [Actinophytocola sp. NPDC049390]|uniref:cold-shock protein n=1 Tax=Actinophytocola sp. NPDC049390 TaxID=3363894 RepID=UPI003791445F
MTAFNGRTCTPCHAASAHKAGKLASQRGCLQSGYPDHTRNHPAAGRGDRASCDSGGASRPWRDHHDVVDKTRRRRGALRSRRARARQAPSRRPRPMSRCPMTSWTVSTRSCLMAGNKYWFKPVVRGSRQFCVFVFPRSRRTFSGVDSTSQGELEKAAISSRLVPRTRGTRNTPEGAHLLAHGIVKRFDPRTGFGLISRAGFVSRDVGGADVLVHHSHVADSTGVLEEGAVVTFTLEHHQRVLRAVAVRAA